MSDHRPSPPLWRQLQAVASVLVQIRGGVSGTVAVAGVAQELRPGVQALTFHVLRQLGRAQALREMLVKRAPALAVDALLCTALGLVWNEDDAPYEEYTLVNQAVEAAKRDPACRAQASFVNACLRRFLRERRSLVSATDIHPVALWNHPRWWIDRLMADWPLRWQAILRANNRHAPLSLRVNSRQSTAAAYVEVLRQTGNEAKVAGACGVVLKHARPVLDLPGFAQGVVSVQDSAAQLAAPLLLDGMDATPLRVLDACAAPGGKTAHLLELRDCHLTALDIDPARCERIRETLARLGLHATVIQADACQTSTWWDGQAYDAILLDAPCSASGIVRRHPDIRWLRRESDIAQLTQVQAGLLHALWPLLKPGGRLLYCTCSVLRCEGEEQIQTFLAHNTQASLLPSPGHLIPQEEANGESVQDNPACDHDGFFYALLEKRAA